MSSFSNNNDFLDPGPLNFDFDDSHFLTFPDGDHLWLGDSDQWIVDTPMQAIDTGSSQQQAQGPSYNEEQAERDLTSMHEVISDIEDAAQTFSSIQAPAKASQIDAQQPVHIKMPPLQYSGDFGASLLGHGQIQLSSGFGGRQSLNPRNSVEAPRRSFSFTSMYDTMPSIENVGHNSTLSLESTQNNQTSTQRSPSSQGPRSQYKNTVSTSLVRPRQSQQSTGLADRMSANPRMFMTWPAHNDGNHGSARQEIMRMRQQGAFTASHSDYQRAGLAMEKATRNNREASTSPDRIVDASKRRAAVVGAGTTARESQTRDQQRASQILYSSNIDTIDPSDSSPTSSTIQPDIPSYAPHGIVSTDDAMRVAFGSIGRRKQLSGGTSWRTVKASQHAWAKKFYDVLLERQDEGPPIKLDNKGFKMYTNQQNRFTEKLKGLLVQQGKKYDAVLPQVSANCFLQVEAVVVLHRDGVPKLDFDEAVIGSRAQRQKLDLELKCIDRLEQMIRAARDLKSIAFDVATGKNQHVFAYSPQGYINGKLGNIQSNATRKSNKKGEEATTASSRDVSSPADEASPDHGIPLHRKRRVLSRASTDEDDGVDSDPDYVDPLGPKRRKRNNV